MNKLISKHPVQRFKQGRKVQRFANPSSGIYPNGTYYEKSQNGKVVEKGRWQNGKQVPFQSVSTIPEITVTGKNRRPINYQFGKMGGWNRSMGNSIDQDSLNMIKEMGMEGKSAQDIQNEINRVFGSNAVKVDNKWGNQSRAGLKALYDNWKLINTPKAETVTKPSADIKSPSALGSTSYAMKDIIAEPTPQQRAEQEMFNNTQNLIFKRNGNYNKSGIRNLIRNYGLKAYDFTGTQRKALRQYLNGESNDTSLLTNGLERFIVPYKQGGQLISRNPIQRFKLRTKI